MTKFKQLCHHKKTFRLIIQMMNGVLIKSNSLDTVPLFTGEYPGQRHKINVHHSRVQKSECIRKNITRYDKLLSELCKYPFTATGS